MLFNSIDFLVFFPAVTLIYFVIPKNRRSLWLLLASYYFYMGWNPKYAILIGISTLITYLSGIWMEHSQGKYKKPAICFSLLSNLGILVLFKYANFLLGLLDALFSAVGLQLADRRLDLLLPVGISFYTFQALGYTIDVYRGQTKAERNLLQLEMGWSIKLYLKRWMHWESRLANCRYENLVQTNIFQYPPQSTV